METPTVVSAPVYYGANAVQNTHQQLATHLHQIQAMIQAMQVQYATAPQGERQDYGGRGYYGHQSNITVEEDAVHNTTVIGAKAVVVESTVILHITVVHTECVPIWAQTSEPWQTDTRRTRCRAIRCREVSETVPDRLGSYLIVKILWKKLKYLINMN